MATASQTDPDEWELIPEAEPPLSPRDLDYALAGHLTRTERRKLYKAMKAAGLIMFWE